MTDHAPFLAMLRAAGVAKFVGVPPGDLNQISVEFWPPTTAAPADTGPAYPVAPPADEKCACGHLRDAEHNNDGLCIAGACAPTVCNPATPPT